MGVYVKNMEMPKACVYRQDGHLTTCPLYDIDGYCSALNTEAIHQEDGKLQNCPLVELPPHGRLIDADSLRLLYDFKNYKPTMTEDEFDLLMCTLPVIRANIDNASTIIESEGE